ncbi:hypothetical protein BMS3Bbin06_00690 [bacterium BMS3Bbin06]|nr:hypothetical protein BMS3Abin08_01303 [bacterium BMS3Abin08]GBE34170.1 hypothetical protein BMS3Bbin06_00690 [bacterium BMS3Bbin06]HDO36608.1 hypothetical protein [Nitrospirota bacterium]HDY71247.1 hypothetical protein [Nitrospirota bacterium]
MKKLVVIVLSVIFSVTFTYSYSLAVSSGSLKISEASEVLEEIMSIPEKGIPPALLKNVQGIAIIPGVIKVGLIIGGRHGSGILSIRDENGNWTNPTFITITGGSIGWQIGAKSTDIILVFKTRKSISNIMKGQFTLGADVAIAAGPVGRSAEAATDAQLKAEIYSYSRSRGLFAGVSLEGAALSIDDKANVEFYKKEGIQVKDIFSNRGISSSKVVEKLLSLLSKYTKP